MKSQLRMKPRVALNTAILADADTNPTCWSSEDSALLRFVE